MANRERNQENEMMEKQNQQSNQQGPGASKLDGIYSLVDNLVDQYITSQPRGRALKYGVRAVGELILAYQESQNEDHSKKKDEGSHAHHDGRAHKRG